MINSQGLKCGLESMPEVKSQEQEACNIENIHPENLEFFNDHGSHVMIMFAIVNNLFHIPASELGLDVEVHQVDNQEDQNDSGSMDHEF